MNEAAEDFAQFMNDQSALFGEDKSLDELLEGAELEEDEELEGEDEEEEGNRNPSTQEVIDALEQSDPEAAHVIRSMRSQMDRQTQRVNDMMDHMLEIKEALIASRSGSQAEDSDGGSEEGSRPEHITDEHLESFEIMAKELGYEKKADVDRRSQSEARESHSDAEMREAVNL